MTNLSIVPAKLEVQLKPGATYIQSYIVKNSGDQTITLNTSLNSWLPVGPDGNIKYLDSSPDLVTSLSNTDIQFGQNFILNPKQSRQIVLKIQVPENTINGDRYFTLFFNQDDSASLSSNSTQLIRIGSHLLISISESETNISKFSINNFKTNTHFIDCFFGTIKFTGIINNPSNTFNKVDDSIIISKNNSVITKLPIFPDNILANHNRTLRCQNNNLPVDCQLQKPFWPGIYSASYADKSITFFVFPYSILLALLVIAVIIKTIIDNIKHNKL